MLFIVVRLTWALTAWPPVALESEPITHAKLRTDFSIIKIKVRCYVYLSKMISTFWDVNLLKFQLVKAYIIETILDIDWPKVKV